jgi:hypothetical protein
MIKKTYYTLFELLVVLFMALIGIFIVCIVVGVIMVGCHVYENGLESTAERVIKGKPDVEQVEQGNPEAVND